MKRIGKFLTIFAVAMTLLPINARAAELLIPVGKIVGLQLSDNTVTVAAFDDVLGAEARTAGLKISRSTRPPLIAPRMSAGRLRAATATPS